MELQDRRVNLAEQREARFARAQQQREQRQGGRSIPSPGRVARTVTGPSRGDAAGLSTALLAALALVAIRVCADFTTTTVPLTESSSGQTTSNTVTRAKILHPSGELGPIPILVGIVLSFFFLSLLGASGGFRAKVAITFGWLIVLGLGMNSLPEIDKLASLIGNVGSIAAPAPSGSESSGASSGNQAASSGGGSGSGGGGGTPTSTTPTTNAFGAGNRAAENLVKNFLPDLAGSFDIANPGRVISATNQQWSDLSNAVSDYATAGTDATWLALKKAASSVGLTPASNFFQKIGNGIYNFFKGVF